MDRSDHRFDQDISTDVCIPVRLLTLQFIIRIIGNRLEVGVQSKYRLTRTVI